MTKAVMSAQGYENVIHALQHQAALKAVKHLCTIVEAGPIGGDDADSEALLDWLNAVDLLNRFNDRISKQQHAEAVAELESMNAPASLRPLDDLAPLPH